jgi:lipopolysaccharide export LptBFGC system permease protein LptF
MPILVETASEPQQTCPMSLLATFKSWIPFSTLDRYLLRQLLMNILIAVLVLSVVLVLGQIFKAMWELILRDQLPIEKLPGLIWNMFGSSLSYTVPWGILTGVMLMFGRLSADNELTAMRMAGRSLWRICYPIFLLAALLCLGCFWINTRLAPQAYKEVRTQKYALALENPTKLLTADEVIEEIPGHVIYCKEKEGDLLKHFIALQFEPTFDPPELSKIMLAKESEITASLKTKSIDIKSREFRALTHSYKDYDAAGKPLSLEKVAEMRAAGERPAETRLEVPPASSSRLFDSSMDLSSFFNKATRPRVAGMTMTELRQVNAALANVREDPSMSVVSDEALRNHLLAMPDKDRRIMETDTLTTFNNRFSFSMAGLVLSLCGISFGITAQRRDTSSGAVLSFAVGIAYFALIMLAEVWKGKPQMHPELWVWLPNVLFGLIGLGLFWKHSRR